MVIGLPTTNAGCDLLLFAAMTIRDVGAGTARHETWILPSRFPHNQSGYDSLT
jgi:hypothetical protein